MFYATRIRMRSNCYYSNNLVEIDSIYLDNSKDGWYKKEILHDYLKEHPKSIQVKNAYGPYLIPAISDNNEKFVKSEPNYTTTDNLLTLPKE